MIAINAPHRPRSAPTALTALFPALAGTLLLLLATSCSILPEREPSRIFEPKRAPLVTDAAWPQAAWSLVIAKPLAGQLLDTDNIIVRPQPGLVQVYKAANWSDSAPELLQTALIRSFEDSGRILSVSRPGVGVRGEYRLVTELRAFESVYTQPGQPEAQIEIYAKLINAADGEVIAARNFRESEAASSEDIGAVVDAFSRGLDRASNQMVGWTLTLGNGYQARSGVASP